MSSAWWLTALAVLTLTSLSFFVFPGHTILQSDTQIYIPILEHLSDPSLLRNDIMAVRPHVSFTLYDEAALSLRRITGLSFEQVISGQQFVYRAVAVLGFYLFATATGLSPAMAWLTAGLLSLGAAVIGPSVLTVEYEPVPRGFSLPFVVFSLAMVAHRRWTTAAVAATAAFSFHPPTALAYCALLTIVLLSRRVYPALAVLGIGPALIVITMLMQPANGAPLFGHLDPAWEALQRMRASYNWVSIWAKDWLWMYFLLSIAGLIAWLRVRRDLPRETNIFLLVLPIIGMLSVPVSYVLLERMKWIFIPQFQPGRYLLFIMLFALLLATIAAIRAAERKSYVEACVFFLLPLAAASTEWDTARLWGPRLVLLFGLALLSIAAVVWRSYPALTAIAVILPFLALPYIGGIQNFAALHTEDLDTLAEWARGNTSPDAVFQFADAERKLDPGVFRARAKRALYADWKAGGQVNFLTPSSFPWAERWEIARKQQPMDTYRSLHIDYVVFKAANRQPEYVPVYQNSAWVVYDLRNASTSGRAGIDACAPIRVTESAAAAFANRSASSTDCPSVNATANAALKVSPAAVVSSTFTRKPGE
jgi:hypothetical protein